MKKLQNNFTTPEQSKQLLEIGLPADSADCFLSLDSHVYVLSVDPFSVYYAQLVDPIIPCWSVGRLIEIWNITGYLMPGCELVFYTETNYIEKIMNQFILAKKYGLIDFTQLED